jgi:hypothetical protein
MFVAVFVRRLPPGKSYEDFLAAWYPDRGFGFGGRGPITPDGSTTSGRSLPSPASTYRGKRSATPMARVADQEAVGHDRINEVIESTSLRGFYDSRRDHCSTDESVARGGPASTFVTSRLAAALGTPRTSCMAGRVTSRAGQERGASGEDGAT